MRTPLGRLLSRRGADSLAPVFGTRIRRTSYKVSRRGSVIEAAVDHGTVHAGPRHQMICELELELLSGRPHALFDLARTLAADATMQLAFRTKSDRGYALLRPSRGSGPTTGAHHASRSATAGEAFQVIARGCIRQIAANEQAALADDAAGLHRARVGLRRLRAALSLFAPVVDDRDLRTLKAGLRWISGELGPARDVDVFMADVVVPLRDRHPRSPDVRRLFRTFATRRVLAYERVAASLRSERFRILELDLVQWVESGPWTRSRKVSTRRSRDRAVVPFARRELTRRFRRLHATPSHLSRLSHPDLHRLRIRVKKLRYGVEFFWPLFRGKKRSTRGRVMLGALEELQDALGALNDLVRRQDFAALAASGGGAGIQLGRSGPARTAIVERALFSPQTAHVARLYHDAERALECLCALEPFWG